MKTVVVVGVAQALVLCVGSLLAVQAAGLQVTGGLALRVALVGVAVAGLTVLLAMRHARAQDEALRSWSDDLEGKVRRRTEQLKRTHKAIIFGMAKLSEYRDNETGMHVERMCAYSAVLARELQRRGHDIDDAWIEDLELAASLHDIGKVSIPDSILLKPGSLTPAEFDRMKRHAAVGEETLAAVRAEIDDPQQLDLAIEIAGGHHERWDGTGYPRGLAGHDIPLSARIVAVADVFDALMSKRVYKDAMPFDVVTQIINDGKGAHFDPELVDAFNSVSKELLKIRSEYRDVDQVPSLVLHRDIGGPVAVGDGA